MEADYSTNSPYKTWVCSRNWFSGWEDNPERFYWRLDFAWSEHLIAFVACEDLGYDLEF